MSVYSRHFILCVRAGRDVRFLPDYENCSQLKQDDFLTLLKSGLAEAAQMQFQDFRIADIKSKESFYYNILLGKRRKRIPHNTAGIYTYIFINYVSVRCIIYYIIYSNITLGAI